MIPALFVFLTFVISIIAAWFTIPHIVVISKRKRLFDVPNMRKVHTNSVSRLGGVSFFPCAMFAFSLVLGLRYYFHYGVDIGYEGTLITDFLFVISGLFIIFIIGLADDLVGVSYKPKFLVQFFGGLMLVMARLNLSDLTGFFGIHELSWIVSSVLTVFFVIFVINAFNLIDGIDGLCSGIGSIVLAILGLWYVYIEFYVYAMFAFGILGVVVTFFSYNFFGSRLKIFMGDTGSLTLGYMITFLSLKLITINDAPESTLPSIIVSSGDFYHLYNPLALVVGMLFVPLFDTIRVSVGRILIGKSPFSADKTHIHHKLIAMGISHRKCTVILLGAVISFFALNVLLSEFFKLNINFIIFIDITLGLSINSYMNHVIHSREAIIERNTILEKNIDAGTDTE